MKQFFIMLALVTLVFSVHAASCNEKTDDSLINFSYCLELAKKGDVSAQFDVAYKYYYGIGVTRNLVQAFEWYEKSAIQENYLAQNILGSMYYNGEGVQQSFENAVTWYIKSAEHGHPYAPFKLGEMYYMGEGVTQDLMSSLMWCYIAEKKGIKKAGKFRFELEKKMRFEQIKKARDMSTAWIAEHNKNKHER